LNRNRFSVVLDSDRDKAKPPTFWFRQASKSEWMRMAAIGATIKNPADAIAAVYRGLRMVLVDWHNVVTAEGKRVLYRPDATEDILTPYEALELLHQAAKRQWQRPAMVRARPSPAAN